MSSAERWREAERERQAIMEQDARAYAESMLKLRELRRLNIEGREQQARERAEEKRQRDERLSRPRPVERVVPGLGDSARQAPAASALERVKRDVRTLSAEDRGRLVLWLAQGMPEPEEGPKEE